MATVSAMVFEHHKKAGGTYIVKICAQHKRLSKHLNAHTVCCCESFECCIGIRKFEKRTIVMVTEKKMPSGKFTQAQLELLRMFSKQYPDKVWEEVKDILSKYFMEKASDEMDNLFEEKGWDDEQIKEWASEHMRTPYQKKNE